jgi:hypothetical protein
VQLSLLIVLATAFLATILWDSALILPFKLLVVFVHEIWHGMATIFTGGQVSTIAISMDGAGETNVSNINGVASFVATVSAGYIGSAFSGSILLHFSLKQRYEKAILIGSGLLLAYFAILFTEPMSLAFNTAAGWAGALLLSSFINKNAMRALLLSTGTAMIWYCLYDMFDFAGRIEATDAGILARFLIEQGLNFEQSTLSYAISFCWVAAMFAIMLLLLIPPLRSTRAAGLPAAPDIIAPGMSNFPASSGLPGNPGAFPENY